MPTPEQTQALQDKLDAELFRAVLKALLVEKNRPLLLQVAAAIPPNLMAPLMARGQALAEGK